ncbi:MAG TPA: cupin domain-containing protein [Pirellulales bacterium]|nr:cupin domain-containing protein [Pirellulales bacterium]
MESSNILAKVPSNLPGEFIEILVQASHVRIERIVSQGHNSPRGFWYDQDTDEWVMLVEGAARLRFDDGVVEMRNGDYLHIPAHKRHRVEWTDPHRPTVWVAVHWGAP